MRPFDHRGQWVNPLPRSRLRGSLLVALAVIASGASGAPASAQIALDSAREASPPAEPAAAGVPLTIRVSELKNDRGRVAVALFASAEDFPDQKKALAGKLTRIEHGRAAVTFTDLRPGVYAVAVLHDENENAKMDFNFLGMPLEGYGFSNDAPVTFGPPSFEAAAFKLSPRPSYMPIKMRYFL